MCGAEGNGLGRRARGRLSRRREIIAAARAVFLAKGYERATLDDIARRAEFAKGTLYNYFHSKGELFEALADEVFGEVIAEVRAATAPARTVGEAVVAATAVVLKYITVHDHFFRMAMAHQGRARREDVARIRSVIARRIEELAAATGERLVAAGGAATKGYDAVFLGLILLGLVHYYSIYFLKYKRGEFHEDAALFVSRLFTSGLLPPPAK